MGDFATKFTNDGIANFTSAQSQNLLPSVFSQLNYTQISYFTPAAFGKLYSQDYHHLTARILSQLPDQLILAIPSDQFKNCEFSKIVSQSGRQKALTGASL